MGGTLPDVMALPLLYTFLALAFTGVLLLFLARPALARPLTVWALAAGLPVLAAVAAALTGQARADALLRTYVPVPVTVAVTSLGRTRTVTLNAQDAACVTRARMTATDQTLVLPAPEQPLRLRKGAVISGDLPPVRTVQALTVRGALTCRNLRAASQREQDDDEALLKSGR